LATGEKGANWGGRGTKRGDARKASTSEPLLTSIRVCPKKKKIVVRRGKGIIASKCLQGESGASPMFLQNYSQRNVGGGGGEKKGMKLWVRRRESGGDGKDESHC